MFATELKNGGMVVENTQNIKLSIIVPVFMVERYLPKCIESILNQKMSDFELILVDDCSPDNSGKICDNYAKLDKRIRVIHNRERKGAGKTRYVGLSVARGNYVGFVDADDWIHKDMYHVLCDVVQLYSAEVACCEFIFEYVNQTVVLAKKSHTKILSQTDAMLNIHTGEAVYPYLFNKVFKKDILVQPCEENEIVIGEDYRFVVNVLKNANRIVWVNRPLYYYRQRKTSACNKGFTKKHLSVLKNYQEMRQQLSLEYPELSQVINSYCVTEEMIILQSMAKNKVYEKEMAKYVKTDIAQNLNQYLHQNHISKMFKLSGIIITLCPRLFVWIMKIYILIKNKRNILFE